MRQDHCSITAPSALGGEEVLAGVFGEGTQRDSIKAMQAVLTNPRTVLKALELCARLNRELDSAHRMVPVQGP